MSPETIPKPPNPSRRIINIDGGSESLAHQMRLDGSKSNRKLYFDIVHNTGMLCQEHFPFKEGVSGGCRMKPILRILAPKLLERFPVLHNYANQWPIAVMVSRHYAMCQGGSKNGLIRSASGGQFTPLEMIVGSHTNTRGMDVPGSRATSGLPRELYYSQDIARSKRSGNNVHNDQDKEATLLFSSQTLTPEASVVQFLTTLAQDLSGLLPVFIDHGVGDDACLRNMLRMKNWRAWMYAWVKEGVLTELQFQMIVDGLKKLILFVYSVHRHRGHRHREMEKFKLQDWWEKKFQSKPEEHVKYES